MKKHIQEFLKRGMMACWGGPVILAVVYGILGACGVVESLSPLEVTKGILTVTLMAFTVAGITVVYQIDKLPLVPALLIHGLVLYFDYLMIYLANDWIAQGWRPLMIFTCIFVAGYALIWLIVYTVIKRNTTNINKKLAG